VGNARRKLEVVNDAQKGSVTEEEAYLWAFKGFMNVGSATP